MAIWKNHLNIKTEWQAAKSGDLSTADLAKAIAAKLRMLPIYADETTEVRDLVDEFEAIAAGYGDVDDFDNIMSALYDWGDTAPDNVWPTTKMCWIGTF